MNITLIAVGKHMPSWVNAGYQEYAKRLSSAIKLELKEIPLPKRSKQAAIQPLIAKEGKAMLAAIPAGAMVIALDIKGKQWNTEELAQQLRRWQENSQHLCLLVGGPDGLASSCLQTAQEHWSLSKLTLPHPLVRIVVAEQLYRAWSLLNGHPYHR